MCLVCAMADPLCCTGVVVPPCGHPQCHACVNAKRRDEQPLHYNTQVGWHKCAVCRAQYDPEELRAVTTFQEFVVATLGETCPNPGCGFKTSPAELAWHEDVCTFRRKRCSHCNGLFGPDRADPDAHDCGEIPCPQAAYCSGRGVEHIRQCVVARAVTATQAANAAEIQRLNERITDQATVLETAGFEAGVAGGQGTVGRNQQLEDLASEVAVAMDRYRLARGRITAFQAVNHLDVHRCEEAFSELNTAINRLHSPQSPIQSPASSPVYNPDSPAPSMYFRIDTDSDTE